MPSPLRVLHLEDSARDAEVVRHKLDAGALSCDVLLVNSKDSFEAALRQEPFDLILSDYDLPGYDGVAALKLAQLAQPDVPVIIISGTVGEEEGVRCLHLGATDYLLKDRLDRLVPAVQRAIQEAEARRTRKGVEAALVDLRDAVNLHAIVAVTDTRGTITFVNDKFCDVSGYRREELIGQDHRIINSGHHPKEFMRDLWTTIKSGNAWHGEIKNKAKNGSYYWLDTTIVPFLNDDGTPRQYMAIRGVITERKEAELALRDAVEALRIAEERTQFVLQNANVGVWDMDYSTGALRWSGTMEAQYGLVPGTFGGTFDAFVARIHPDDRTSVLETLGKAVTSGSDFSVLNRAIWPDGDVKWLSGAGRILLGEHGEPVRAVGISLDVTERRTLEQQFQQAQKMDAVGQLAGGVAHDFNNLLTVILGSCELLSADLASGDTRQGDISEIQKAGMRAAGLTRQLLTFSRNQIIEPTRLDLNVVVADMQTMLRRLIREDVKVVLSLGSELAAVNADRGEVEQIVMNLAVNARDAMPNGGTLIIETANVELDEHYAKTHVGVKSGSHVMLTVTDTGTGMTPQVKARLFEPFFTTKEPGKGTGLGMATVFRIVTRSGGSIGVDSDLGKGTSFKVYFPRADAHETVVHAPATHGGQAAGTQTVLLVEDEEGLRELTKRLLTRQGYTVVVAGDAEEAIRCFDENPSIDVLLTDVVMPGASGPELVGQLVARRPGLKVIYMSGYTDDAIDHHGVLNPGIAFLHKPFTSDALGRKIREVLAS
jgi:two-component system cell cycle sensor histidine kinase/response regulator CckA